MKTCLALLTLITPLSLLAPGAVAAPDYSGDDIAGIESIVDDIRDGKDAWRVEANERIDQIRKGDTAIRVVDAQGKPVSGAKVRATLDRHAFRFGCALSAPKFSGKFPDTDPAVYKQAYLNFGFTMGGFNNGFKYKQRKNMAPLVPPVLKWFAENEIPVRAHVLIWPGWDHMDSEAKTLAGKTEELRAYCEKMVVDYARRWDVVEWDVINEPRGNHDVPDILGEEVMADWFKLARENVLNKGALLYLNENRVVSDTAPGDVTDKMRGFRKTAEDLLNNGAPLTALGFQSRWRFDTPAETIWKRLNYFNDFNLPIAATEFEMKDEMGDELTKARMTERVMTVYFSHPNVNSIFAWTFSKHGQNRCIVDNNGAPNLRGKVWLHMMKQHWTTDETLTTRADGSARLRGFKGRYRVTVDGKSVDGFEIDGDNATATVTLK